uniref:Uncharacterized protein n=1 Tax=viral metagenome TaxID=1070528 RepID=A0A6M3IF66_9ZZZZ
MARRIKRSEEDDVKANESKSISREEILGTVVLKAPSAFSLRVLSTCAFYSDGHAMTRKELGDGSVEVTMKFIPAIPAKATPEQKESDEEQTAETQDGGEVAGTEEGS